MTRKGMGLAPVARKKYAERWATNGQISNLWRVEVQPGRGKKRGWREKKIVLGEMREISSDARAVRVKDRENSLFAQIGRFEGVRRTLTGGKRGTYPSLGRPGKSDTNEDTGGKRVKQEAHHLVARSTETQLLRGENLIQYFGGWLRSSLCLIRPRLRQSTG